MKTIRIIFFSILIILLSNCNKCKNNLCCDKGSDCNKGECVCNEGVTGTLCDEFLLNNFTGKYLGNASYTFNNGNGGGTLGFDSIYITNPSVNVFDSLNITIDNMFSFYAIVLSESTLAIPQQLNIDGCGLSGQVEFVNSQLIEITLDKQDVDYLYQFEISISRVEEQEKVAC